MTLTRTTIHPADEAEWLALRTEDITSTEISALFGLSPYCTKFELWHRKKAGEVVALEPNERMVWGTRLQNSIAFGVIEDRDWAGRPMTEYMRLDGLRIGSSFDWRINADHSGRQGECDGGADWLLEIKNVDSLAFKQGWSETDYGLEAPEHIELQVQHQMLVSGLNKAYIAALIGGNRVELLERTADPAVHRGILRACADFWRSIDANEPPTPDFRADAAFIADLYRYAEPGKVIDESHPKSGRIIELCSLYRAASHAETEAKENREAAKAELLTIIGDAEKVYMPGFNVSASMVPPSEVKAYTRKPYRLVRISEKGEK